ncbi:sialidase family protein [Devosia rhodophyticola]|uniref:Sialidase family protein n=1 Tax=Devosia rhodophyticola TaxID=3026423 RepID=A0ABY7YXZ1_9HYPH|nr:sialidase family protein [Devosia rhodophyticola]WDR06191.1 sialidase family protein [Devosia rhodophyticola]
MSKMHISARGTLVEAEAGTDHAALTFPTITCLSNGDMLACWRQGSSKECDSEIIGFRRSTDNGRTWGKTYFPFDAATVDGRNGSLKICYVTQITPDQLVAAVMWVDRTAFPGQPLFNPETEGCLPMAILLAHSHDNGQTWSGFSKVDLPENLGPPSLTNPMMVLTDGTWLLSIETNKTYMDGSPWKQKAVFVRSEDKGEHWSDPWDVAVDPSGRIFNWDLRCVVTPTDEIATFAWTYDKKANRYLNIHRRISTDGGRSWTASEDLGITDQAGRPATLRDGRLLLPWVDRFGCASIQLRTAQGIDAPFQPDTQIDLHQQLETDSRTNAATGELLAEMGLWNFGLPYAEAAPDGGAIVCYYAGTPEAMSLHWMRINP